MHQYTTPLLLPEERQPLEILPARKPPFWRVFWIGLILIKLAGMSILNKIKKQKFNEDQATYVREFLENLGGVWIKVGQVLALRSDLFSPEICSQLARLHDRAMSFPPELACEIIERNLECKIDEVFEDFEAEAFAAASLSQVHKARLRENGERVVVKVQRPFAKAYFRYDFRWLSFFCKMITKMGMMKEFRLNEMMEQISDMMVEELDYRQEAGNVKRMRESLQHHNIDVPKIYSKYVTKEILVMEFLNGVFVSDYIRLRKEDPERVKIWAKENEIDPAKVASQLFQSIFRQLYEDRLFHGDLHPGNIVLLRKSRLAFIDFGNVGQIDPKFAKNYNRYFNAMAMGALDEAADALMISLGKLPAIDIALFKKRLIRVMQKQIDRGYIENLPYHERSIASNSAKMSEVMMEFGIEVDWNLLKMGRAFETIDQNIGGLNPDFNFVDEIIEYQVEAGKRKRCQQLKSSSSKLAEIMDLIGVVKTLVTDKAFQFSGQMSRFDQLLVMVTKWVSFIFWVALILGVWLYIYQYHNSLVDQFHDLKSEHWFSDVIEEFPKVAQQVWLLKLVVVGVLLLQLRKLVKNMRKSGTKS